MIFSDREYQKMKGAIDACLTTNRPVDASEAMKLGFDYDALVSLYSQMFIRYQKLDLKEFYGSKGEKMWRMIKDRLSKEKELNLQKVYLEISHKYRLGPLKFAKMYMESEGKTFNIPNFLANPTVIADERLRRDILKLIESDPLCSHDVELLKECVGREYEELLNNLLNSRHMCFETEAQIRAMGKPKTPDVLFLIPMAIDVPKHLLTLHIKGVTSPTALADSEDLGNRLAACSMDGSFDLENPADLQLNDNEAPASPCVNLGVDIKKGVNSGSGSSNSSSAGKLVINWIDSKAMFADLDTFQDHLEQFRKYNNRYGRGLVIYWHGFVEEILTSEGADDRMIVVTDRFPDSWIFPSGEPADGRVPQFNSIKT